MSCVWRPHYHDKKTGERKQQRVYHAKFNLKRGEPYIRKTTGLTDKRAAERRMTEMIEEERRLRDGLADPTLLFRGKTLDDHVADFEAALWSRDITAGYVHERIQNLKSMLAFVPSRTLAALHQFRLDKFLESDAAKLKARRSWRKEPKGLLAARSLNKRIKALRQFGKWLEDEGRIPKSPFRKLPLRNEATDPRYVRTVYAPGQSFDNFLRAVRRRPLADAEKQRVIAGVSPAERKRLRRLGQVRALIYLFAQLTGLRRGEITALAKGDLDLDRGNYRVLAVNAKGRHEDTNPLRDDLLRLLRAYDRTRPGRNPRCRFFEGDNGRSLVPSIKTLQDDLAAGGIPRTNARGEVLDFHALRTTCITNAVNENMHPKKIQVLARHRKFETTMKYYARVDIEDLRAEINKALPQRARIAVVDRS